jgi:O-antigen/teichoic acid export membrane protein
MYGLYSLAFVLPALFASIIDFGLSDALTRFAAIFKSQQKCARLASMMSSVLGQIRILGAASRLIFAYETRLLNAFEQKTNAAGELK